MSHSFDTFDQESTDLDLHVQLCAKRYAELDSRLCQITEKVDAIDQKLDNNRSDIVKALVGTAGTIVVAVVGAVALFLSRMP